MEDHEFGHACYTHHIWEKGGVFGKSERDESCDGFFFGVRNVTTWIMKRPTKLGQQQESIRTYHFVPRGTTKEGKNS